MKYLIIICILATALFAEELKVTYLKFEDGSTFEIVRYHGVTIDGVTKYIITNTRGEQFEKQGKIIETDVRMVDVKDLDPKAISLLKKHTEDKSKKIVDMTNKAEGVRSEKEVKEYYRATITRINIITNKYKQLKTKLDTATRQLDDLTLQENNLIADAQIAAAGRGGERMTTGEAQDNQRRYKEMMLKVMNIRKVRMQLSFDVKNLPEQMEALKNERKPLEQELQELETYIKTNRINQDILPIFGLN